MLAYLAENRPSRRPSARTLALVIAGHAGLLALVLTARGDMPGVPKFDPTVITFIDPIKPPPPPPPPSPSPPQANPLSRIDTPPVIIPTPQPQPVPIDAGPAPVDLTPYAGNDVVPLPGPTVIEPRRPAVIKAARFATPPDAVRPPYPESKRRLEEEASLRLALEIDARGRVIAVEPVGAADPAFLDAARRHILKRWRYQPATEDGVGVPSRLVVTLRFELE